MDGGIQDNVELLSTTDWTSRRRFSNESRSASISFPMSSTESNSAALSHDASRSTKEDGDDNNEVKHKHLTKSGKLGMCNDPYCVTCPTAYNDNGQLLISRVSLGLDHNILPYAGARRQAREKLSILKKFTFGFGVMNPHAKFIQQWNKIIVLSCLLAMIIDPLFFFLLSVNKMQYYKCIVIDWPLTTIIMVFRSVTDLIYLMHMLVQFRLAFISPESGVVGAGKLVDDPKKVALNYLTSFFPLDLFIVIPLPQIIVSLILKDHVASSGANYAKNILRAVVLVQYIPRLSRFLPLLAGQSPTGFIFESAWANFVINLLTFVLAGHVVGSCWYLFGLQRVNQCLRDACHKSGFKNCKKLIDCGHGSEFGSLAVNRSDWKENKNSAACFIKDGDFHYGIYAEAINLTAENSTITRYVYSFFWGFQQISTLAGNQVPSYFVWEVLFTMGIVGLGLLLFALLIGNMQNFLQGLGRRRLEMSLRRRDVEQWMKHRHLPEEIRSKVRDSERFNWAATQGVNEENLMEYLPEDLQRDICRNLFKFLKTVEIFSKMDEPILDAIGERLRHTTYIKGGTIFYRGEFVTKMVFIVKGKMESTREDGNRTTLLSEGDVCGKELLERCLELSSTNGDTRNQRNLGYILVSNRTVKCLTNVEAFVLRAADLKEATTLYAGFL